MIADRAMSEEASSTSRNAEPPSPVPAKPMAAAIAAAAQVDPRVEFERRLVHEILGAERFRAMLLLAIPSFSAVALAVVGGAYPDTVAALLHGRFDWSQVGLFLIIVAAFELYVLLWLRRLLERDQAPSTLRRYLHAFVETSLPTAAILYYAAIDGPIQALLMPSAFVYSIFILLSTLGLDFFLCAFTGLVAAAEYSAVVLLWGVTDTRVAEPGLASVPHHIAKAAILFVSGIAAGFVARRLRGAFSNAIESVGERARILGVFGQHVSPEVVERLVAGKTEVESELSPVCVMFFDIRNFTAFSESKSPAEVVDFLNVVFESTIDAVVSRQGIVNKFLGDGFMAVFGAPMSEQNASRAAVDAALDIVERVKALVEEGRIPPTTVGVGLHTGTAIVGNIGSAQRKEYTVIGDVVNVASRIEALNKELGSCVLASDETWTACGRDDVSAVPHERAIRGRKQAARVWQLA